MTLKRPLALLTLGALCLTLGVQAQAKPDTQARSHRPTDNEALMKAGYKHSQLKKRRRALLKALPKGSVLLVAATRPPAEDYHPYRQHPDFLYLTGLNQGPCYVLLIKNQKGEEQDILLLPRRNRYQEMWEGKKPNLDSESATVRGHSALEDIRKLSKLINESLKSAKSFYISGIKKKELKERGIQVPSGVEVKSAVYPIAKLRLVKDAGEIALLQRAIDITAAAQIEAMKSIRPGQYEYEVQGCIEYLFKRYGARLPAFNSICGSGPKSCVLHYSANTRRMKAGDMIVADVGARFAGYCADVTRTFPVSGKFSPRQKEIYNVVLRAQLAGIRAVKPGATLRDVHRAASNVIRQAGYGRYFQHGTSHWLGLETHDTQQISLNTELKPGMVLTVEPGIYIAAEELGVRIEDDVVVTKNGCRVLSNGVPKTVEEIEKIMKGSRGVGARKVAPVILRGKESQKTPPKETEKKPLAGPTKRRLY